MDRVHAEQLLHGYRNGHELLAGSVKLPQKDAELVARLSDLSGTLQSGIHFYPYLSVYPLPSGDYYAIARTWLDYDAPRSGCVLTRTLLVRTGDWTGGSIGIDDVVEHLRAPTRSEAAQYRGPITIEPRSAQLLPSADAAPSELEEFVGKYFSDGIRPVVWFRDNDPGKLLIAVISRLWPSLRVKFAACTLSLQPRSLPGGPFDLLFAPTSVYSRFSKIPRENLIDVGKSVRSQRNEPWVSALASTLATAYPLPVPPDWPDFKQALTDDPTSIRWLYLLNDLRARTAESSMAALGVMDVIETLCPDPAAKTDLKAAAAAAAIKSADQISDTFQTFSHLQLICERLSHVPYAGIGQQVLSELSARVARAAAIDVGQALSGYEALQLRSRDDSAPLGAFQAGLTRALMTVSADTPDLLSVLHAHEVAARAIIPSNVQLAERYLRLGCEKGIDVGGDVVSWLDGAAASIDWLAYSHLAVSLASTLRDGRLLCKALSHLASREAESFLKDTAPSALEQASVAEAIAQQLLVRLPLVVRAWALGLSGTSKGAASLAALTFEWSESGIRELMSEQTVAMPDRVAVLAAMVTRIRGTPPSWFSSYLRDDSSIFVSVLNEAARGSALASSAAAKLLPDLEPFGPDALCPLAQTVEKLSSAPLFGALCNFVVRNALRWIVRGDLSGAAFNDLGGCPQIARWIAGMDGIVIAELIVTETKSDSESVARAWSWLAKAPEPIYQSRDRITIAVIDRLKRQQGRTWSRTIGNAWVDVLKRADHFCEPRVALGHKVQALEFAFANTVLPLSATVRAAFPTVYQTVIEQSPIASEADRLFSYEWDKAKALRKNLIDAFYYSDWPAGDLALTAKESFGLRKLFKRVWRKWSGKAYIERMIRDLTLRDDPESTEGKDELTRCLANPDFYEPWV